MKTSEEGKAIISEMIAKAERKGKLKNKIIVNFGCSAAIHDVADALKKYGYKFEAIIDNRKSILGKKCMDLPICLPEAFFSVNNNTFLIPSISHPI